jgi:hypothetical protein
MEDSPGNLQRHPSKELTPRRWLRPDRGCEPAVAATKRRTWVPWRRSLTAATPSRVHHDLYLGQRGYAAP